MKSQNSGNLVDFPWRAAWIGLLLACLTPAWQSMAATASSSATRMNSRAPGTSSLQKLLSNPPDARLQIQVKDLCADANDYMELTIGGQRQVFQGAGVDSLGQFIPTNHAATVFTVALRREYQMNITCTNTGPTGSCLFKLEDFWDVDGFVSVLTNSESPALLSEFLWTNFTAGARLVLTDPGSSFELKQTNLVQQLNSILRGPSIFEANRFAGVDLSTEAEDLLEAEPDGWDLVRLNRVLLFDAYMAFIPYYYGGDSSGTANISFFVLPPHEYDLNTSQPPPQYTVLNNREVLPDATSLRLLKPDDGYVSTNYSTIEVVKERFAHWAIDDACNDPRPAAGEGNWLSMGPSCTMDTNAMRLDWSVSLGRLFDGLVAGRLRLHELELTRASCQPFSIYYNAGSTNIRNQVELVTTNSDGVLRQVKSCQAFVDILAPDTNQTILRFYHPSQVGTNRDVMGVYTSIPETNFVSWTIQNPEPSTTNKLLIIEERYGERSTNSLVKVATANGVRWTLRYGSGATEREEIRDVGFVGVPATNRFETNIIRYASGASAYQCVETYRLYPWGTEIKQVRLAGNPDQVTTYEYYDNTAELYGDHGYGQLKHTIYPDGYWEKRVYEYLGDRNDISDDYLDPCWPYLYYWNGLLRYVFEPDDEREGGAVSPDQAYWDNTFFREFAYPDLWQGSMASRFSMRFYGESPGGIANHTDIARRSSHSGPDPNTDGTWSFSSKGNDEDHGWWVTHFEYGVGSPAGLAGHAWFEEPRDGQNLFAFYYYDHGEFDAEANEFQLNATNHLYSPASVTNGYPHHRETKIILESGLNVPNGDYHWGHKPFQDWFEPRDDYSQLEDHPMFWDYAGLYKGSSMKQVRIFQGGNLVQTEDWIYVGKSGEDPVWNRLQKTRYFNDTLGRATNIVEFGGDLPRTNGTFSYRDPAGYDGELLLSATDEYGVTKTYTYDSLKRVKTSVSKGYGTQPDATTAISYDACGRTLTNLLTAGALSLKECWQFDLAGRQIRRVDRSGITVTTAYSADGKSVTNLFPGGVKSVVENYLTRQTRSITGNAAVNEFYVHDANAKGIGQYRNTTIHYGSVDSPRWETRGLNMVDYEAYYERPVSEVSTNTLATIKDYRVWGYLAYEETPPGFADTLYTYDPMGNRRETRVGGDFGRITGTDQVNVELYDKWYHASTNYVYLIDESTNRTVTSVVLEQLNGFTGGEISHVIEYDVDMNQTVTSTYLDRSQNKLTVVTSSPATSSLSATNIIQNGMLQQSSSLSVAVPIRYSYDDLGRTNGIQDSLGFSTSLTYYPATGWLESITDAAGHITRYEYYNTNQANAGKVRCVTAPGGKKSYYSYTTRGELYRTWGDVPYPAEYRYNQYGDLTNMITFRGGSYWEWASWPAGHTGSGDNTYWRHDAASGALLRKTDAQGRSTTYSYCTNTGRLLTRSWQRTTGAEFVTVTNTFNMFDDLLLQEYNDGTPDVVFNNYNRIGLPREIIDARGTSSLVYDHAGRLVSTTGEDGIMAGITVSNHFHAAHGRDVLRVTGLSSTLTHEFGYDLYGRLATVDSGNYWASYGYVPDSDLLQTTTCRSNSTEVLNTTRRWEYGMRLGGIVNEIPGAGVVSSHGYAYDAANRRTRAYLEDGSSWIYGYNDRDELVSAKRYWDDLTPYSGQQFGYQYDNIGNRQKAWNGGNNQGANLRETAYLANSLNQYTNVQTLGYKHIAGIAFATNVVTVNAGATERRVEWFDREIPVFNANGPVWQNVTNVAGTVSSNGGFVFPKFSQEIKYDADGNLTNDGVWAYEWDAENRLKAMSMTTFTNLVPAQRKRLEFGYDFMGRRFSKVVKTWNGSAFTNPSTNLFVYDGWNLLVIIDPNKTLVTSFLWGQDLSGTMNKAGGIGGLLAVLEGANAHFATYDGNGNITGLIKGDKSSSARYESSPFGETLRATGPMAAANPFRFSTKYLDEESGLVYYGYRYYSPTLGRWISRDPAGENGGLNLHALIRNRAPNTYDTDGRSEGLDMAAATGIAAGLGAFTATTSALVFNDLCNHKEINWGRDLGLGVLAGLTGGGLAGMAVAGELATVSLGDFVFNCVMSSIGGVITGTTGAMVEKTWSEDTENRVKKYVEDNVTLTADDINLAIWLY